MQAVINDLNTAGTVTVNVVRAEIDRSIVRQTIAKLAVIREDIKIDISEYNSEIRLVKDDGEARFSGVVTQKNRKKGLIEFVVESYERYAKDAPPVSASTSFTGELDVDIIYDLLEGNTGPGVDQISGDKSLMNQIENDINIDFSNISIAKCIRKITEITGGEILYTPNKNVKYKDKLGSDKTNSTTLTPTSKNTSKINVNTKSGDQRATHLRMLGASSGPSQVTADVIADGYNADEDREVWTTEIDKSINKVGLLQQKGKKLINEKYNKTVDIRATVRPPVVVELGDKFTINYEQENINNIQLRAVEVKEIYDSDGERYETVFSTIEQDRRTEQQKTNKTVIEQSVEEDNSDVFGLPQFKNPSDASGSSGVIWANGGVERDEKGDIRPEDWPPDTRRGIFTYSIQDVSTKTREEDGVEIIELDEEYTRGGSGSISDLGRLNILGKDLTYGPYPETKTIFSYEDELLSGDVIPPIDARRFNFSNISHGDQLTANPDDHHQPPKVNVGTLECNADKDLGYTESVEIGFRPTYVEIHCIYNKSSIGNIYSEDPEQLEQFITSGQSYGIGYDEVGQTSQVVNMSTTSPGYPGGNKSYTDTGKILYMEEEVDNGSGSFHTNKVEARLSALKTFGFTLEWTENDFGATAIYKAFR